MLTVFYHDDLDGFASAWAHHHLTKKDPPVNYLPIQYGDELLEIENGSEVIFLDFCPKPEQIDCLLDDLNCLLIVIDHHKTSEKTIHSFGDRPNFYYSFDIEYSGCVLTWYRFNTSSQGERIPQGLKLIEDRDLWKFKHPETKPFCLYADSAERDFGVWTAIMTEAHSVSIGVQYGLHILRYQDKLVEHMVRGAVREFWSFLPQKPNYVVMGANASFLSSEVCARLLKDYPDVDFVATYSKRKNVTTWQLRSLGDFDVSEIAKLNGGGGHKNAAGFVE